MAIAGSALSLRGAFVAAFVREVEARNGRIVRRETAPPSGRDNGPLAISLKASGADVLLWDGPGRDAETLIRALATEGASLRMCGGPALTPAC